MNVWKNSENQDIFKAKGELDFFLADNGELKRITFERPYYLSIHNKDENFVDWLYERFFEKNIYHTFSGQKQKSPNRCKECHFPDPAARRRRLCHNCRLKPHKDPWRKNSLSSRPVKFSPGF